MTTTPKPSVANSLKIYLFPSLVTILAMLIWRDVTELRSDVKLLLSESSSNKTKVEILEKQVNQLNQAVFKIPRTAGNTPQEDDNQPLLSSLYAVLNKDEYYAYIKKNKTN